jgi:hypothetical protein
MKYFQLFCGTPSDDFIESLLACYGLKSLQDKWEFCKNDLIEMKTVEKLEELLPEMVMYYIPCKAKIYLNNIDEKRAITILSQFLKLFDYKMSRKEKLVSKKKIIYYKIQKNEDTKLHIDNSNTYELLFR